LKPSLQPQTNNDIIKPVFCTKKVDNYSKQKPEP
jgi:hypothetical protein